MILDRYLVGTYLDFFLSLMKMIINTSGHIHSRARGYFDVYFVELSVRRSVLVHASRFITLETQVKCILVYMYRDVLLHYTNV